LLSPPPSVAYVPEGDRRRGDLACALASAAGIVLDEWQQLALSAGLDRRGDHWSAFEVGIIVPRQNGKTFLLAIREIAGILLFGERLVIHSAHEWRTVSEQFVATVALIEGSPLRKYLKSVRRTGGEESITFINGGRLRFMNRSRESARGFSADLVVIDEAHALTVEHQAALVPILSAKPDAQIWLAAAGPSFTAWALAAVRARVTQPDGPPGKLCWLEWSADPAADDLESPEVWSACNPAVSSGRLDLERIAAERQTLGATAFAAERLAAAPWPTELGSDLQIFTDEEWARMLAMDGSPQ
jgi:hypothetical protein